MTPEDEEFNRVEMESRIKQEHIKSLNRKRQVSDSVAMPDYLNLMEELAVARAQIRDLEARIKYMEKNA